MSEWIRIEDSEIGTHTKDGYYWCFEERWEDPYISYFCSTRGWFYDRDDSKCWPEFIKEIMTPEPPKES